MDNVNNYLKMKKHMFKYSIFYLFNLLLMTWISQASASLVLDDWNTLDDRLIVRDERTGLEWLNLGLTTGLSFNQVNAQLGAGGSYQGFRFATLEEVESLYISADIFGSHSNLVGDETEKQKVVNFIDMIGETERNSGSGYESAHATGLLADITSGGAHLTASAWWHHSGQQILAYARQYSISLLPDSNYGNPGSHLVRGTMTLPQLFNPANKLTYAANQQGDQFAFTVDADNGIWVLGAPHADGAESDSGAIYVFENGANGGKKATRLYASDGQTGDYFGYSVAIDGETIIVGAPKTSDGLYNLMGAVYIFNRIGDGAWNETKLLPSLAEKQSRLHFGSSVDIHNDIYAVGAPRFFENTGFFGALGYTYIYNRDTSNNWIEQKVYGDNNNLGGGAEFGYKVKLDNDILVVSSHRENVSRQGGSGSNDHNGAVYIYQRDINNVWSFLQKLNPYLEFASYFGQDIDLHNGQLVVGAPGYYLDEGRAFLYQQQSDGSWQKDKTLIALRRGNNEKFGDSVAIDGDRIVVGATQQSNKGLAYVFDRVSDTSFSENILDNPDDTLAISFASSLAIDRVTGLILVGAPNSDDPDINAGALYVFDQNLDTDNDGMINIIDQDDDGDLISDDADAFPLNADEQSDSDGDFLGDNTDICPNAYNIDQLDSDMDGIGDACDYDDDNDGIDDITDNCSLISNSGQTNTDSDLFGDACDDDDDNDGVDDNVDNCPLISNSGQNNTDSDLFGDACDNDDDNDGIEDNVDNCPLIPNLNQTNTDSDLFGDVCDDDKDNDGVTDNFDAFPLLNSESLDSDNDGIGDNADNCPLNNNVDQLDSNNDGLGDVCTPVEAGDNDVSNTDNDASASAGGMDIWFIILVLVLSHLTRQFRYLG